MISEICTKKESRFKEAFIALLSLPELGAWITFLVFHYYRRGIGGSFALGIIAALIYGILNFVHMIIHPRMIVPNSMSSYKALNSNYRFSTWLMRMISYFLSFKFSLILVSYLCLKPRFKGDYSALNWKQFNRFGLAFICLPYPIMMFACSYYLYTEGLFSYASFVAIECIALSTLIASLMLLDAVSALKFSSKNTASDKNKVMTGADYESEDEGAAKKIRKKNRNKEMDEFGADEVEPLGDGAESN